MSPHLSALGFTLIHFCWQAALIAGLYRLAELSLPRLRSPERYLLGLVAMVAMLAVAVATFVLEDLRLSREAVVVALTPAASAEAGASGASLTMGGLLPWLDAAWLAGVVALSLRMIGGLWFIRRLAAAAEAVPEAVARRFDVLARRSGLKAVRLRLHRQIDGPFVVGAMRAVVYLPVSALTSLSPDQLDAVLAHELEHVRRADYLWNLVQSAIETLFFFHPAVWWLGARLREQRELCCDDAAVALCRDPLTYATALLHLEEQRRAAPRLAVALNGQETGRTLVARVARVLGEKAVGPAKGRPLAAHAVPAVLLILAVFFAPFARVAAHPQTAAVIQARDASDAQTLSETATAVGEESPAPLMDDATAAEVESRSHAPRIMRCAPCSAPAAAAQAGRAEAEAVAAATRWTRDNEANIERDARATLPDATIPDADRLRIEADAQKAVSEALKEHAGDLARAQQALAEQDGDLRAARGVWDHDRSRRPMIVQAVPEAPAPPPPPEARHAVPAPAAAPSPPAAPSPHAKPAPAAAPEADSPEVNSDVVVHVDLPGSKVFVATAKISEP